MLQKNNCKQQKNAFILLHYIVCLVVCVSMKPLVSILFHFLLFHAGRGQMMGGVPAGPRQFPFAVQVLGANYTRICGGSIIGHQWVITAGHCVRENGTHMITGIVAGDEFLRDLANDTRRVEILNDQIEIITPLRYDEDEYTYDAALLFLKTPLKSSSRVKMIELGSNLALRAGDECTLMGWGRTKVEWGPPGSHDNHIQSEISSFLRYGKLTVSAVNLHLILFAGVSRDGDSPYMLMGDSGSPLVCRDTDGKQKLFGWQHSVETDKNFFTYRNVAFFRDWIEGKMKMKRILSEYIGDGSDFRQYD